MRGYSTIFLAACLLLLSCAPCRAGEASAPITAERAREIALSLCGGGDVMELDRHYRGDRGYYYRVEVVNPEGAYHVEIDERDGGLLQFIRKHGRRRAWTPPPSVPAPAAGGVSYEQALAIALAETGGGVLVESDIDRTKHGDVVYEFEIVDRGVKYDVEINGHDGGVRKFKRKGKRGGIPTPPPSQPAPAASVTDSAGPRLGADEAQALAIGKVGGGVVKEYELELDDGRLVHEVTIVHDRTMYELEVDDATGAIVEFSID